MPRTLPAAISAKVGQANPGSFLWLIEWALSSGTLYLSSGRSVTYNSHTYEANRVMSIGGMTAQYIDRKERDFSSITIKLDNLADNQSSAFPFTVLDASQVFEDALLKVHLYDVDASVAVDSLWFGYSGRPRFNPSDKSVDLTARFLWEGAGITMPSLSLQQAGFSSIDSNRKKEFPPDETAVPMVYGVSDFKIRPTLYRASVEMNSLFINGIVSGTAAGLPMSAGDMTVGHCKLFDNTQATAIEFRPGGTDTVPDNLTRYPDGLAHNNVAYFSAIFLINNQTKDRLDRIKPDDVKITLGNGRPLIDTGLPSQNPVLILKDVLRDPLYGLGLANAAFDASAITTAAAAAAPNWQARLELHERMELGEFVQRMLADFHGYLTFNNGLIQIGVKGTAESAVATFATSDSGTSARKIHEENVTAYEKEAGDIINEIRLKFRLKNRQERETVLYDATAQNRPGGNIKKVVTDRRDEATESLTLFEPSQVAINGAIILREELNGNLFIEFTTPLVEALSVAPGDIIIVKSPDIPNNASNDDFRVISQTFDTESFLVTFKCQVYKPAVYNYNTTGIGVDLLRGGEDTSSQGRPPDVTPVSLAVVDTETNDTGGKLATIRAAWSYPVVDLATERADGVFREYPIGAVRLYWHYTNESINEARPEKEVRYPTATGDFQIDYYKNKSIRVFFVALGHNRSQSEIGYIADETKVTALTANLSATGATASVTSASLFTVNDFVLIENEIAKVASKTGSSITFVTSGGNRLAHFDTTAIAHPSGTQIAVAKLSYPSLVLALTAPRFTYPVVTGVVAKKRETGVIVKWADPSAENRENFLVYWSIDSDANSNAAKLGVNNPSWYLIDPLTPPASVHLAKNDDLDILLLQEDIGAAGTTVYVRVAARNGKHNFSSTLSSIVSNSPFGDTGAAGAVQNILLTYNNRKGYKVTFDPPATNKQSLIGYRILYYDGGSNFMNAITGAVASPNSVAGAQFFYTGNQHATHVKKADLAAPFLTGVVARVIPVNKIDGVETDGTAAFSGVVLPVDPDPMANDTAVPSGLDPSVVLLYKKKGLVVKFAQATANMNTHTQNFIVIKKTGSSLYLTETSSGYATTATEASGRINVGKTGRPVIPISKTDLQSLFGSSGTFEAYYYAANSIGTSAASATSNTVNLATLEAEGLDTDSAVPSGLDSSPVLLYKKKGLVFKFAQATANMVTHSHNLVVIKKTGASLYLTETSLGYSTTATEASGRINVGKTGRPVFPIAKADIQALFGSSGSFEAYYYAVNSVGTSAASGTSNTVNLATLEAEGIDGDTAAPTLGAAPTIEEQDGSIFVTCPTPTANINTLDQFQVIMSTSSSAPAGDPTVGVSGVVKIKFGQSVSFKPKRPQDVTLWFYYRTRNQANGTATYSSWSSGTSLATSGISRPLEDVIGTSVPVHSEQLEFSSATSPSGHAFAAFVLPSGASAVDDFYNGMALHCPTLTNTNRVRMITDYDGATRTCTVSPLFDTAPVGSTAHEIHRIAVPGDVAGKSGTGHTVNTFVLPSSASSVNDFYRAYSLYIPSAAPADKVRKVLSYVGSTRTLTLELPVAVAPSGNVGFMLINGSWGNASPDQTGIFAPVPFRWYLDGATQRNVFEILPPTDQNAFSLQAFQINIRRGNATAPLKADSGARPISSGLGWEWSAPAAYTPVAAIRFRNLYRGGGSNGWSTYSYWVPVSKDLSNGGVANYDAERFGGPVDLDYQSPSSYPGRYPNY